MPIIDMQRQMRQLGRIRMGHQVPTSNGTRPAKLDNWRLTSSSSDALEAAAAIYGGEVKVWDGQPGQFELYTTSDALRIWLMPGPSTFSQWLELWSGGGCLRRCDGDYDRIGEGPCICRVEQMTGEERKCEEHTRISVMLPDVIGIGHWRLDTQGYYAAMELSGMVEMLQRAAARGQILDARLRIEQRTAKRDGQTRRFNVPVIETDVTLRQALGSAAAGLALPEATPNLDVSADRAEHEDLTPTASPAATAEARRGATIEEGLASIEGERSNEGRRSTPPPLPGALEDGDAPAPVEVLPAEPQPATPPPPEPVAELNPISDGQRKLLFASARDRRMDETSIKAIIREVTGQESSKGIDKRQFDAVLALIQAQAIPS